MLHVSKVDQEAIEILRFAAAGSPGKYFAGNVFMSPTYNRYIIVLSGDPELKLMLVQVPGKYPMLHDTGCTVKTEADGKWLYTPDELRKKLEAWTWLGQHCRIPPANGGIRLEP